jgi:hypothetical protein
MSLEPLSSSPQEKKCPRCGTAFECRADEIAECQCNAIELNEAERTFVSNAYVDCLCAKCLREVKDAYNVLLSPDFV